MSRNGLAELPEFLRRLPKADVGLAGVEAHVIRGPTLCVLFEFSGDVHVPEHVHGAQFGYVLAGSLRVGRSGRVQELQAGDSYLIDSQEPHEAWIAKGTTLIEFFEDADRY